MSLLHQDSPEEIDDAALGEEFTKGSSHLIWTGVIAAVVVTIVIAIYVFVGQKPPAITGEIEQVWAHPMHTETSGFDASGAAIPRESFDQVMVFARVKLHNQSKIPLFLLHVLTNATLTDGIHSSYAASATQYDELFMVHPELAWLHGAALSPHATIDAGQTVEGTLVSSFHLTKQQWDAHKDLNFTFSVRYQPLLVLAPKTAVTEIP
jgi:hypothetical protein